jgi:hypothetical protein
MTKASSKKRSSVKYDVIIKAKATSTRIVDISNEIVRFESNDKGRVEGEVNTTKETVDVKGNFTTLGV